MNNRYFTDNTGKAECAVEGDSESTSSVKDADQTAGRKRKAAGSVKSENKDSAESCGAPQYCHWLMKSEPESRFENGIDVKVQCAIPIKHSILFIITLFQQMLKPVIFQFGIQDLKALPDQTGCWDGVRNYQV